MAQTTVRDVVIWTKHVRGDDMARRLAALPEDAEITLRVDGVSGRWCKMRNGKDGRPTSGLRPVGRAQAFWQSLFESRRGESVSVELVGDDGDFSSTLNSHPDEPVEFKTRKSEREAARATLLAAPSLGWSLDGQTWTRDELYDR